MLLKDLKIGDRVKYKHYYNSIDFDINEGIINRFNANNKDFIEITSFVGKFFGHKTIKENIISKLEPLPPQYNKININELSESIKSQNKNLIENLNDNQLKTIINLCAEIIELRRQKNSEPQYKEIPIENKKTKLEDLTEKQFNSLKESGLLFEICPESDGVYKSKSCESGKENSYGTPPGKIERVYPETSFHCPKCDKKLWGLSGLSVKRIIDEPCKQCQEKPEPKSFKFDIEYANCIEWHQTPNTRYSPPYGYFKIGGMKIINHDTPNPITDLNGKKFTIEIKEKID